MFWKVVLIVFLPNCILSEQVTLIPNDGTVIENEKIILTCSHNGTDQISSSRWIYSAASANPVILLKNGSCVAVGFLNNSALYEWTCHRNNSFSLTIKKVERKNHGETWKCRQEKSESNTVAIFVIVPVSKVEMTMPTTNKTTISESSKEQFVCNTSPARPGSKVEWLIAKTPAASDVVQIIDNVTQFNTTDDEGLVNSTGILIYEPKRSVNTWFIYCIAYNVKDRQVQSNKIQLNVTNMQSLILSPEFSNVLINSSLELTCDALNNVNVTKWGTINQAKLFSHLRYVKEGNCLTEGFLAGNQYFETSCYSNATFKVKIKRVNVSNHHQKWYCAHQYTQSNTAFINVQVPTKYVTFKNISGDSLKIIENNRITLTCETSEGRPAANITWTKVFKGLRTNLTDNVAYNISSTEKLLMGSMTIVTSSSIDIEPAREDNGASIICEAKNTKESRKVTKEVTIHVQCKPDRPTMFEHLNEYVTEASASLRWKPGFNGGFEQLFILRYKLYSGSDWVNVTLFDVLGKTMNYTLNGLESDSVYYTELFAVNTVGKSMTLNLTFKTKDCPKLTENLVHDWMYVTYTSGGVILVVVVLFVTTFTRRRLNQHSADTAFRQNVPYSVSDNSNIYQTFPFCAQTADQNVFPSGTAVNESQKVTGRPQVIIMSLNQQEIDLDVEEPYSEASDDYNTLEIISKHEKIKITELYDYLKDRTEESFNVDFQKIPTGFQMPCCFARKPENIAFNRYRGILPYDHTRVYIDDQPDFFINASYIDGYIKPKRYIACSGPTAATHDNFKTFWKMVWHEKSELIVMVTNLNELSGMKCEKYWPDPSQDEMYGDILVSCQKIEMFAEYTIRSFEVTRTTNAETFCRRLVHLHYTAWPDKKTPEDVMTLLEFRQIFLDTRTTVNGPVIIHCSAGIGRTGVFIAIDRLITEGVNEGSVNVIACITKMREQRVKMVQTSEQFKFIFQALAYALNFDCGPIPIESLKDHNIILDDEFLDRQYKELESSLEMESKEKIDSRAKNKSYKDKNRQRADIPDNTNRVYLYLNRSYEDSDYINAVFINSYRCKDHFIMAQSPLPGTESDFLTMIYQENCFCVVSMEDLDDQEMKIGKHYLEEKGSLDIGSLTVSCVINDSKPQYTVRKVTMTNKDEFSTGKRDFYHFQYNNWTTENDIPLKVEEFLEFVKDVQEYAILGDEKSHVLVHCLKANERSGLFCAIAIIREKLLYDEQVSVLNTLRHLRTRRPSAITSMEQLKFCYIAAEVIAQKQNEGIYINN